MATRRKYSKRKYTKRKRTVKSRTYKKRGGYISVKDNVSNKNKIKKPSNKPNKRKSARMNANK